MAHAFDLFAELYSDGDGSPGSESKPGTISYELVRHFVRAFMLVIYALTMDPRASLDGVDSIIAAHTEAVVTLLQRVAKDGCACITFDTFATWYNRHGGHAFSPWMELLDIRKWFVASAPSHE